MTRRRKASSDLSAEIVEFVLNHTGMTQEQLAESLEVSAGFISRLRNKERSFTIDHLEMVANLTNMPLGAMLLAASPPPPARPETAKLLRLCVEAINLADQASEKLKSKHGV